MLDALQNTANSPPASVRTESVARPSAPRAPDVVVQNEPGPKGSPQISVDPVVGVILEFLNASGSVETQSPSFAAEAYLRAGLTAEGFSKAPEEPRTQFTA